MRDEDDVFRDFISSGVSVRILRGLDTGPADMPCKGIPTRSWQRLWNLGLVQKQGSKLHLTDLGGRMLARLDLMRYRAPQ